MTIGIGVLCSSQPRPHEPRPDAFIMVADTMGSTETDSVDDFHKMMCLRDPVLGVTCAGDVGMTAELCPMFHRNISALQRKTHGTIWETLSQSVHGHRTQHFQWDVLMARYSFDVEGKVSAQMVPEINKEWQAYKTGASALVGVFEDSGQSLLYSIGTEYDAAGGLVPGFVHLKQFPGHWSIGSGAVNADFWLNYRGQQLGLGIVQSAYHAFEAKIMAARAPTVNHRTEMIVAIPEGSFHLTEENPSAEGCPVSLTGLADMFKRYGPQDTNALGNQRTKAMTSSMDQT